MLRGVSTRVGEDLDFWDSWVIFGGNLWKKRWDKKLHMAGWPAAFRRGI